MTIKVGDKIPSISLKRATADGKIEDVTTDDYFAGRKVVLFAVPGAFTPTCSGQHLPGFVDKASDLRAKGADAIACISVNDAFVMGAWAKDRSVGESVDMLADGSGDFAKAVDLEMDGSKFGMGTRAQRFALIADDGVVTHLAVEAPMKFEVSSAEAILDAL